MITLWNHAATIQLGDASAFEMDVLIDGESLWKRSSRRMLAFCTIKTWWWTRAWCYECCCGLALECRRECETKMFRSIYTSEKNNGLERPLSPLLRVFRWLIAQPCTIQALSAKLSPAYDSSKPWFGYGRSSHCWSMILPGAPIMFKNTCGHYRSIQALQDGSNDLSTTSQLMISCYIPSLSNPGSAWTGT